MSGLGEVGFQRKVERGEGGGGKGRGGRQGGTHVAHLVTVCLHDFWVARVDLLSEVLTDELQNGIMC